MISLPDKLTPFDRGQAQATIDYAYANIFTIDELLDMRNGAFKDHRYQDRMYFTVYKTSLMLRFFVEEHPKHGLLKGLSVYNRSGDMQLVNPESLLLIGIKYYGFDINEHFWFEDPEFLANGITCLALCQATTIDAKPSGPLSI